ncbi:Calpain-like protease [Dirofilaria immitis]
MVNLRRSRNRNRNRSVTVTVTVTVTITITITITITVAVAGDVAVTTVAIVTGRTRETIIPFAVVEPPTHICYRSSRPFDYVCHPLHSNCSLVCRVVGKGGGCGSTDSICNGSHCVTSVHIVLTGRNINRDI